MKTCPQCLRKIEDVELVCGYCGYQMNNRAAAVAGGQLSTIEDQAKTTASPAKPAGLNNFQRLSVIAVLVLVIGGAGFLTALRTRTEDSSAISSASQRPHGRGATPGSGSASPAQSEPAVSKWRGSRQPGWASDGSRTIRFAVEAENQVQVWMKSVRPVLNVRCLGGNTEVFVVTNWAASIESVADLHAVHLSFDDGPTMDELWLDSDDVQALFAPDGAAIARQLAGARRMRFGFTPFNAAPVTVEFNVTGFDQLVGSIAKTCRWKS